MSERTRTEKKNKEEKNRNKWEKKRRESCFFLRMRAALQNALTKTTGRTTTLTSTTPTIGSGCGAASRRQSGSVCAKTTTGTSSSSPHRHHHRHHKRTLSVATKREGMAKNWDGSGTQEDLMHRDECILVDSRDAITGYASKYDAHHFSTNAEGRNTPKGLLHRAFSVFLFDKENNKLLLQQRAASKITFPLVWTNTCCSHQLHGYDPTEVDDEEEDVRKNKRAPGAIRAARRKLLHELNIDPETVKETQFKFLTRLHYCAKDSFGEKSLRPENGTAFWGEHEMDYVLFCRADQEQLVKGGMSINPEEVDAMIWVSPEELREMMKEEKGLRWSPWFRIIVERFLWKWWENIDEVFATDKFVDEQNIHEVLEEEG